MQRFLCFLSVLLFVPLPAVPQSKSSGEITGHVREQGTHAPLAGVNVLLVGTNLGAATDADGGFRITSIGPGTYSLRASLIGFTTVVRTDVVVTSGQESQIIVELSETVLDMEEVTVNASYFARPVELATSAHVLSFEEVRRSPGAAEDVSRVMQSLPGVVFSTDLRNDLIVRGGSPTENLTTVDNIEIPNINHFATQGASGGPIGMVNTEFIRGVTFITGGFPAKYGDKLSSVLEVELREGNREQVSGQANVNAAGAGILGEGPLGNGGSWMASLRKSYLDFLLRNFHFAGITIVPDYADIQGKIAVDLDKENKVSIVAIGGIDDVKFANVDKENLGANPDLSGVDKATNHQYQYLVGGTWKRLWGSAGSTFLTLSNNLNYYFTDIDDSLGAKTYRNKSTESEYVLKLDALFQLGAHQQIAFGGGAKLIDVRHGIFIKADTSRWADRTTGTGIFPELSFDKKLNSYKLWAYAQYTRWLINRVSVTPGLRVDYFDYVEQGLSVSPRLSLRYYLSERTSVNASAGIYYQTPVYLWLSTDDRNRRLKPLRADHIIVGIEHLVMDDLRFTVDLYRKEYRHYPVSGYIPSYILVNGGAAAGAFIAGDLRSVGTGFANGVELFLQKKLTENYYGTISYSFSRTRFKAFDLVLRPGNYDYGHVLTLIAGYKVSNTLELSAKWRYTAGGPYTPIDEQASRFFGREVLDLSRINAVRYPPYHRLDLRADIRFSIAGLEAIAYIDLQNAYNRKNIFFYSWNDDKERQVTAYQWSLLPILGMKVEF